MEGLIRGTRDEGTRDEGREGRRQKAEDPSTRYACSGQAGDKRRRTRDEKNLDIRSSGRKVSDNQLIRELVKWWID
jgi:hypothetical protein